jgi:hypothetical protein
MTNFGSLTDSQAQRRFGAPTDLRAKDSRPAKPATHRDRAVVAQLVEEREGPNSVIAQMLGVADVAP